MDVTVVDFTSFAESVPLAMDQAGACSVLAGVNRVLLKPNLVNTSGHPITTHVDMCEAVIKYVRQCTDAEIVIGEGVGDSVKETPEVFSALGYDRLAKEYDVELVDLNYAPLLRLENEACPYFPEMFLPEMVFNHFIISLPVLKAHSLATITGTLKNMVGIAPPEHYGSQHGSWKKAFFHGNMHQSIVDLNMYRTPDFTVMDASIGMPDFHLGGRTCVPPIAKLVAGFNPLAVDRKGADLLRIDWRGVPHLVNGS